MQKITILEIGSGARGITPYIPFNIVGADVSFEDPIVGKLRPVYLKGTKLPFSDKSYDCVICVDMLEHVANDERQSVIEEMLRVTKKRLFIAVPCGKSSEEQDKELDILYRKERGEPYRFLTEHVENGLPTKDDIEAYIKNGAARTNSAVHIRVADNVNLRVRFFYMKMSIMRRWSSLYPPLSMILYFLRAFINSGECYRKIFTIDID